MQNWPKLKLGNVEIWYNIAKIIRPLFGKSCLVNVVPNLQ